MPLVPAPARPAPAAAATAPVPALNAQAEARRDYELALQIGNKSALNAFLTQYPDGFYASLAKLQLDKIAAEEVRVAATEKARLAEQERARLATEGAQKTQQAKAEADARAAEQARLAAEKAKQVAQDQAAAAEQKRVAAEAPSDRGSPDKPVNLAALDAGPPQAGITKSVQAELRRVGCLTGAADGDWNTASQRSLTLFNRYAGTKLDAKVASVDTLDAIKLKPSRVCPLVCERGFKADGDRCSKITCAEGSVLNDDNECEKRRARKPVASREEDDRPVRSERPVRERPPSSRPGLPCQSRASPPAEEGDRARSFATNRLPAGQAWLSRRLSGWRTVAVAAAAMRKSAAEGVRSGARCTRYILRFRMGAGPIPTVHGVVFAIFCPKPQSVR